MTFTSERLIYTQVTQAEKENYMSWYTDDTVMQYITGKGLTTEQAEARFEKTLTTNAVDPNMGFYVANHRESGAFVGIVKFTYLNEEQTQAEVGYGMMPEYWGQGYATEMLLCLMKHSRNFPNIEELIGIVNPENLPSVKVLTKQGFTLYRATFGEQPSEYYQLKLK